MNKQPKKQQSFSWCCNCYAPSEDYQSMIAENLQKERAKKAKITKDAKQSDLNNRISLNSQNRNRGVQRNSTISSQENKGFLTTRSNRVQFITQIEPFSHPQEITHRQYSSVVRLPSYPHISTNPHEFQWTKNRDPKHKSLVTFNYSPQHHNHSPSSHIKCQADHVSTINTAFNSPMTKISDQTDTPKLQKKNISGFSLGTDSIRNSMVEFKQDPMIVINGGNSNRKFDSEVRQAVSIIQSQQQSIRQSFVIWKTHFSNSSNKPVAILQPITQSQIDDEGLFSKKYQ